MRAFTVKKSDIDRCPLRSLQVGHYRDDGSCLCEERATLGPTWRGLVELAKEVR